MGRDNLVSEPSLNTLGSWEVVVTTVGLLRIVRTLHIDIMKLGILCCIYVSMGFSLLDNIHSR